MPDVESPQIFGELEMNASAKVKRLLIFRNGSLGDSVVALPALHVLKANFPFAKIFFICDQKVNSARVSGAALFDTPDLVDGFFSYPLGLGFWSGLSAQVRTIWKIRKGRFDVVAYLAPSSRSRLRRYRDELFFRLAGISIILGTKGFRAYKRTDSGMDRQPHEAEQILDRLRLDRLQVPELGQAKFDLKLGKKDFDEVEQWLKSLPTSGGKRWIGVGPTAWRSTQLWPIERYEKTIKKIIKEWDIWPVVFGGPDAIQVGRHLIEHWGRGWNAAGMLSIRGSAAALSRCAAYIGNDTGTLHLADAVGVRCVGVYSSRNPPGKWAPYGKQSFSVVRRIECEGCELEVCEVRALQCLMSISVEDVVPILEQMLGQT